MEASNATSFDTTSWLVRDVSLNYAEVFGSLTSTPIAVSSLRGTYPYALSFIPSGLTHVQYFHDLNEAGESARFPDATSPHGTTRARGNGSATAGLRTP